MVCVRQSLEAFFFPMCQWVPGVVFSCACGFAGVDVFSCACGFAGVDVFPVPVVLQVLMFSSCACGFAGADREDLRWSASSGDAAAGHATPLVHREPATAMDTPSGGPTRLS